MGNGVLFNTDDALGENESKQTPWLNFNSYFISITYLLLDKVHYNCVDTIQDNNDGIFGFR